MRLAWIVIVAWCTPAAAAPDVTSIAAGAAYTCASLADGTVWCWGLCMRTAAGTAACLSGAGQVVPITDATEVVDVAAQDGSGCVVRRKGEVACWWSPEYVAHPVRAARRPHRHLLGRELHRPDRNLRDRLDRAADRGRVVSYRPNFDDANTVSSS